MHKLSNIKKVWKIVVCLLVIFPSATCTSIKMDFLPFANVRTDPIISQTCLSDHVHTFFGATIARPDLTYEDLRNTKGNSGNVEENKSLYWYPTVYRYDSGTDTYTVDPIYFASAYYIWETGQATAFPNGFRMIAGMRASDKTNANAACVEESLCKRDDCSTDNDFFPSTACEEVEASMSFPTCWDGENLDSDDHYSHVAYTDTGDIDGECPEGFPVRIPQIQLFFRIINYDGGKHVFSDNTGRFHADYVSGWDEEFLQNVLDECENESFGALPDAFCEDFLTFRDAPKFWNDDKDDSDIVRGLKPLQPKSPFDTSDITTEKIDNVEKLPRGLCKGSLSSAGKNDPKPSNKPKPTPSSSPKPSKEPSIWDRFTPVFGRNINQ